MSKVLHFLQITAEHPDYPFFTIFLTAKSLSQNFSITLLEISLNFTNIEATIGGKTPLNDFGRTVPSAEK